MLATREVLLAAQGGISDLEALIEISQAWANETLANPLVRRILVTMIEQVSSSHGVVLLGLDDEIQIAAEAICKDGQTKLVEPAGHGADSGTDPTWWASPQTEDRLASLKDSMPTGRTPCLWPMEWGTLLCIPLTVQRRLIGAIYLKCETALRQLPLQRLQFIEAMGLQAATLISNAILSENLERAETEARRARDEWRQEFDLLPVQAWRTDAKGVLEAANKHWHDFTGMTHDYASSEAQQYRNTCHPDDVEKVFGLLSRLHETGVPGEVECRMLRCDGEYRRVLARAAPLHDETGAVIKWHGTNIDIEELKRAEDAQEALARISRVTALGELAVSIAHEVNQPLMSIVTNAASCLRWLTAESPNLSEARLAAQRIVRDGHRAGDVIGSIRELARKSPPNLVEIDVNDVIAEVLALARNELERNEISARTQLATRKCVIIADRVQIQQVVLNLIINGIEAMERTEAPVLTLGTREIDKRLIEVSVSDTGRGLSSVDAERVFDAFFTSKVGGIGMGLSICRSIVENHGGRMAVSENLPQGSTFSFQLPVARAEPPRAHS